MSPYSSDATVAVNRFGLGARPGEIAAVLSDPRGWLHQQLRPETALPAPMAALPSSLDDLGAFRQWTAELARKARAQGMDPATMRSDNRAAQGRAREAQADDGASMRAQAPMVCRSKAASSRYSARATHGP